VNGAIESTLWPGMKKLEPRSELGGIVARKRGYHNSRDHLPTSDYSVREFARDRVGPKNLGSAIDWTFPDAQSGHYATIAKYSKRLYAAGKANDPRTVYMREFFGNTDNDSEVEGWDFSKDRPSSSDKSHLWHIHISVHRQWINSAAAMQAILSILSGQSLADWKKETGQPAPAKAATPTPAPASTDLGKGSKGAAVKTLQAGLNRIFPSYSKLKVDGEYGANTEAVVKEFQRRAKLAVTGKVDARTRAQLGHYGAL
jgi:hypothetical protein